MRSCIQLLTAISFLISLLGTQNNMYNKRYYETFNNRKSIQTICNREYSADQEDPQR